METSGNKKQHFVKSWPEYFAAKKSKAMTAELRKDDRAYRVGDDLIAMEWCPDACEFTGAVVMQKITHVLTGFGMKPGFVMLSLEALA
jgi:hypothetical protein